MKEPQKYAAFVYLNGAQSSLDKARSEDDELNEFCLRFEDGMMTVERVREWLRLASAHFEQKAFASGYQHPLREGFGPGPRDGNGQFRKRSNPNN
jgi:hypothetical protein